MSFEAAVAPYFVQESKIHAANCIEFKLKDDIFMGHMAGRDSPVARAYPTVLSSSSHFSNFLLPRSDSRGLGLPNQQRHQPDCWSKLQPNLWINSWSTSSFKLVTVGLIGPDAQLSGTRPGQASSVIGYRASDTIQNPRPAGRPPHAGSCGTVETSTLSPWPRPSVYMRPGQ